MNHLTDADMDRLLPADWHWCGLSALPRCHADRPQYTGVGSAFDSAAFGQALIVASVLAPCHVDFSLPDGAPHQMYGFSTVDEKMCGGASGGRLSHAQCRPLIHETTIRKSLLWAST